MGRRPCDFRHDYPAVIVQFEIVQPRTTESVKQSGGWLGSACVIFRHDPAIE